MWNEQGVPQRSPGLLERFAVNALAGVGNEREWWIYGIPRGTEITQRHGWTQTRQIRYLIGHLRVGLSADEATALAYYPAVHDAGPSGPERPRTRLPLGSFPKVYRPNRKSRTRRRTP